MDNKCLIISGGEYSPLPEDIKNPGLVLACDRGWKYAEKMGITPDLVIGDFDSSPLPPPKFRVLRVPSEKDDTDTMLAVKEAFRRGFTDISIACAFGGRLDHAFANIQGGAYIAARSGTARLYGKNEQGIIFSNSEVVLPRADGWSLSVFSLSDRSTGVCIRGSKYDCENAVFTGTFPLGASNFWTGDAVTVSVESGIIFVLKSKLQAGEHI